MVVIDEEMSRARFGNNSSQVWNFKAINTSYDSPNCQNLTVLFDVRFEILIKNFYRIFSDDTIEWNVQRTGPSLT